MATGGFSLIPFPLPVLSLGAPASTLTLDAGCGFFTCSGFDANFQIFEPFRAGSGGGGGMGRQYTPTRKKVLAPVGSLLDDLVYLEDDDLLLMAMLE